MANERIDLAAINEADYGGFMTWLGGIFEHSPWVAERVWNARPFATVATLHGAMVAAVRNGSREEQVALLRAHPELAGQEAQAGTLTAASTSEQVSVGMNALTKDEIARITRLNRDYRARFGFPFIIAVRQHTKASILAEFERRLGNAVETELANGLEQVFTITRLRLESLIAG